MCGHSWSGAKASFARLVPPGSLLVTPPARRVVWHQQAWAGPALTAGMSGCHLLCRGFSCSHGFLLRSTVISGVGVLGGMLALSC